MKGDVKRAQYIADNIPEREDILPNNWLMFSEDVEDESVGSIRLLIHQDRFEEALTRLVFELEVACKFRRVHRQIKLYLLEAIACCRLGDAQRALKALRAGLGLAATGPFIRTILDEGEAAIELLHMEYENFKQDGTEFVALRQFSQTLLDAVGVDSGARRRLSSPQGMLPEQLTGREQEILSLLASGAPNRSIARLAYVSENTVKFHLKNIYSKLGVKNRVQATVYARQKDIAGRQGLSGTVE